MPQLGGEGAHVEIEVYRSINFNLGLRWDGGLPTCGCRTRETRGTSRRCVGYEGRGRGAALKAVTRQVWWDFKRPQPRAVGQAVSSITLSCVKGKGGWRHFLRNYARVIIGRTLDTAAHWLPRRMSLWNSSKEYSSHLSVIGYELVISVSLKRPLGGIT